MTHRPARLASMALTGAVALSGIALAAAPAQAAAPDNDDFADATALEGPSGSLSATNIDATTEEGEPGKTGGDGEPANSTVWFSWTAASDGVIQFETEATRSDDPIDTMLDVYTGDSLGTLDTVASDDDGGSGSYSRVSLEAAEGATYWVRVGDFEPDSQGEFLVSWGEAAPEPRTTLKLRKKAKVGSRPVAKFRVRVPGEAAPKGMVYLSTFHRKSGTEDYVNKRLRGGKATLKLPKLKAGKTQVYVYFEAKNGEFTADAGAVIKGVKKKRG